MKSPGFNNDRSLNDDKNMSKKYTANGEILLKRLLLLFNNQLYL